MDEYRRLQELLRGAGGGRETTLYQGVVKSVEGQTCTVTVGKVDVPGVRLKASETEDKGRTLVTPKVGTAVTMGSLSGDMAELVVVQVDHVERIEVNGGLLGGLVNIEELTAKINELVDAFNSHTHQVTVAHPGGTFTTVKPMKAANRFVRGDYEDETIKH